MKKFITKINQVLVMACVCVIFFAQNLNAETQELTLFVGYNNWTQYPIVEIAPVNENLVKLVVLNKDQIYDNNIHYYNTFYFKKGQKLYQQCDNFLRNNYFFPLEKYKGKKSGKDHIVTILSFGYNYITIKQEDVVVPENQ